jgi:hypothetical protein
LTCTCDDGWAGQDCSLHVCPHKCHDHGHCYNGTCYCLGTLNCSFLLILFFLFYR